MKKICFKKVKMWWWSWIIKWRGNRDWTGDLSICSRMLYHWAMPPSPILICRFPCPKLQLPYPVTLFSWKRPATTALSSLTLGFNISPAKLGWCTLLPKVQLIPLIILSCCAYPCEWSHQPTMTDVECQARRVHVANVLLAGPPLPNFSPKESKGKKRYSRNWKE